MSEKLESVTNEHVLEVRYKPNPKVIDHRGSWAEQISTHMGLGHWQIIENRIDVFSDNQIEHAFVGFRNAGYTATDTPTRNFFPDKASKLFRFLFSMDDFGQELFIERIGVRSRFCTPYKGTFDELANVFSKKFLGLTPQVGEAIGNQAKLIDIGAPLNFVDKLGNFNTMSGPMVRKQLDQFFRKSEGFPEVGLYYDIDYFLRPDRNVQGKELLIHIKSFAEEAWDRHERIRNLIIGM